MEDTEHAEKETVIYIGTAEVVSDVEQMEDTVAPDVISEVLPEVKQEEGTLVPGVSELLHKLNTTWKIWYFEPKKDQEWEDCLRVVSSFETVEGFWSIYINIKTPSKLRTGWSYYVFKDGIKPMWEDEGNRKGGRWLVSLNKSNRHHVDRIDGLWLEVLLCLIGEAFDDDGDDVCGAVVDNRLKQDRISIWTANYKHRGQIMNIGQTIKERLSLGNNMMSYESHESAAVRTGSTLKSLFNM